jgi:hypothetical protein
LALRDGQTRSDLAGEIESLGRRVLCLQVDVMHLDQIQQAVTATVGSVVGWVFW